MVACRMCGKDYDPSEGLAHRARCCGAGCYRELLIRCAQGQYDFHCGWNHPMCRARVRNHVVECRDETCGKSQPIAEMNPSGEISGRCVGRVSLSPKWFDLVDKATGEVVT